MKRLILVLFVTIGLLSCQKEYRYVEKRTNSFSGDEEKVFTAKNDSEAFAKGVMYFYISKKVERDMHKQGCSDLPKAVNFAVYDRSGNSVFVPISEDDLRTIAAITGYGDTTASSSYSEGKADSIKVKQLSEKCTFIKDEYNSEEAFLVKSKHAPKNLRKTAISCYFYQKGKSVNSFTFHFQYYARDWLFINKIIFNIDGNNIEYVPEKCECDCANGHICEWSDEVVSYYKDKELVKALANGKVVKAKLFGKKYSEVIKISSDDIEGIKEIYELFIAKGGYLD